MSAKLSDDRGEVSGPFVSLVELVRRGRRHYFSDRDGRIWAHEGDTAMTSKSEPLSGDPAAQQ